MNYKTSGSITLICTTLNIARQIVIFEKNSKLFFFSKNQIIKTASPVISIGNTLVSSEVLEEHFVCDLAKCKGECCIAGDSGAPLEDAELKEIETYFPEVKHMLQPEALESIEKLGVYLKDSDNDWVTPLVNGNRECVYTIFENGIAKCSFEKAYLEGKIPFRKPVSCHLYPIRITKYKDFDAVNYDRWDVCAPACTLGKSLKVPVYKFLKDSLIRKYGDDWYEQLVIAADLLNENRDKR